MALNFAKKAGLAASLIAAQLVGAVSADAHAIWFAQRARQLALIYGVGADDLDAVSRLKLITSVTGLDADGLPVETRLREAGAIPVVDTDEPVAIVAAVMDYGMWTKDTAGIWHNTGKDEVEGPIELSEHNYKYAVYLNGLPEKPVPLIEGQTLQLIPTGPIPTEMGKPLTVRAYYNGKPAAGVKVMTDYVTDPDEVPVETAADGTATVTLRNQGLNVLVGIFVTATDQPAKYDHVEHRASLGFVLPHQPE